MLRNSLKFNISQRSYSVKQMHTCTIFLSGLVKEELQGLDQQLFLEDQAQVLAQISTHLLKMDLTQVLLLPKHPQMVSMALQDLPHTIFLLVGIVKLIIVF